MEKFYKPNTIAILFNEKLNESENLANKIKMILVMILKFLFKALAVAIQNYLPSNPDLLISIGGDGTILRCAKVQMVETVQFLV